MFSKLKLMQFSRKHADFFLFNILVPLWVLTLYFISFSLLLPESINRVFVTRSGKYIFGIVGMLSLLFLISLEHFGIKPSISRWGKRKISLWDAMLILLPLTPIAQYLLNNLDILSVGEVAYLFLGFAVFSVGFILGVPWFLGRIGSSQVLILLGLAFTFSLTNMAIVSHQFSWHEKGSLKTQWIIFMGVFILSCFFVYTNNKKYIYLFVVFVFLSTVVVQFPKESSVLKENDIKSNKLYQLVDSREPNITPDIYLLIYDAYVVNETMLSYGIDNQPQEQYLEYQGFKLYPHTYSVGNHTLATMSRVLNASTEYYGSLSRGTSGDGVIQTILKEFDYNTYGIFVSGHWYRGGVLLAMTIYFLMTRLHQCGFWGQLF